MNDSGAESAKRAVTIRFAGDQLSISVRSVHRLIAAGELKVVRCGRATRVLQSSIDEFLQKGGTHVLPR